jgi:rod shape determining protein RodA
VQVGLLKDYQIDRFRAFYDPAADPKGAGFNVRQAQIAIGSGGVDGQGLFHGTQTQGRFVPAQQTDFIFTVAGEELGFIGAALVVALLGLVLWRAGRIAMGAEDLFGRLLATGVLCWFAFQAFENIGMTLGIMPVTGVPLPFVSYGGSSMFANMIAVGLLQNVHMRRYA